MADRTLAVRCEPPSGWTEAPPRRTAVDDPLAVALAAGGRLELLREVRLAPRREAAAGGSAVVTVGRGEPEGLLVVLRQPSGALSIHRPEPAPRARGPARFKLPLLPPARRGPRGVRPAVVLVLRAAARVEAGAVAALARSFEEAAFRRAGLSEGLVHVTLEGLAEGRLLPASPALLAPPPARNLLLLHGTFSSTAAAFADLGRGGFLEALAP